MYKFLLKLIKPHAQMTCWRHIGFRVQNTLKVFSNIEETVNSLTWLQSFQTLSTKIIQYMQIIYGKISCF